MTTYAKRKLKYSRNENLYLLHCDEWDRFVAPPRHKFVTGATLLQLENTYSKNNSVIPGKFNIYRSCIKSSIAVLKYN